MYITTYIILSLLSVIYLKLAERLNIIDNPNKRSSHTEPTIRGGGILFVFAFLMYQIQVEFTEPYLSIAVIMIAIISFIDDIRTLSPRIRFPFQLVAVIMVVHQVEGFSESIWISLGVIIASTAFINFYNFMDGINGITGLYSIAVLTGIYLVNLKYSVIHHDLIIYQLIALVVFGFYNFRKKARFFAGDIGSISMALMLAYMILTFFYQKPSPIYLLLFVVYGVDSTLTVLYRLVVKENITEAHRHHVYQKLVDQTNLTHLQVSGIYGGIQLLVIGIIWKTLPFTIETHYMVTLVVILFFVLLYFIIFNLFKSNTK